MAHVQQELFDLPVNVAPQPRQLVVKPSPGRVLSRAQRTFNRLITQIERLRAQIKATTARLEEALREHERLVRPRLDEVTQLRKDIIRLLAPVLAERRLKRATDHDLLTNIVVNLIDQVATNEGGIIDDDLRTLYAELTKDEAAEEDADEEENRAAFESMCDEVKTMFGAMGIDVDLSDLGPDMSEEDLMARMHQAMHAAQEREGGRPRAARTRRPTKKQLEREARLREAEEARRRTIGVIYKQLAKTLHPDLEPDPERRQEKLALMQQLTAAHRENDLHTLLRLELEWLHRESVEQNIDRLSEEKLAIYNTVLKEQVAELEQEELAVQRHPRFQALFVGDVRLIGIIKQEPPAVRAERLDRVAETLRHDQTLLRGPGAMKRVRAILKETREAMRRPRYTPF